MCISMITVVSLMLATIHCTVRYGLRIIGMTLVCLDIPHNKILSVV